MSGADGSARTREMVGRRILTVLLVVSGVLHGVVAVRSWPSVAGVLAAVVAVLALGTAVLVVVRAGQRILLTGVLVGAAGVAVFLVPALLALGAGGTPGTVLDTWSIGGFLADTLVVRLAAVTLRRSAGTPTPPR